jgi:hypothetical protein
VFIIQPYGHEHSKLFLDLVIRVCNDSQGVFEPSSAMTDPSEAGPRLQDRIDAYIKSADICVSDLSGVTNQNALLETGAAYSLNIPVIPVSDKEDLPADIRGNLFIKLSTNDLGRQALQNRFMGELKIRLQEASHQIGRHNREQFIAYGFKSRRAVDFHSYVKRCQNRIDILTTNLGFFVQEKLKCNYPERLSMLQMIELELPRKPLAFNIRMLVLDPDSNFTNDRALALNRERREFRDHMREDLEIVKAFLQSGKCQRRFQIKMYDTFPLQMVYFFDDVIVSSVVAMSVSSRECITYTHSVHAQGVKETYERHFDELWGKSTHYATSTVSGDRVKNWIGLTPNPTHLLQADGVPETPAPGERRVVDPPQP